MIELNYVGRDEIKIVHKVDLKSEFFELVNKVDVTSINFLKKPMDYLYVIDRKSKIDSLLDNNDINNLIRCNYFNIYELFVFLKKYKELYGDGNMRLAFDALKNFSFAHKSDRVKYLFIPLLFERDKYGSIEVNHINNLKKKTKDSIYFDYTINMGVKSKPRLKKYGLDEKYVISDRLALKKISISFRDINGSSFIGNTKVLKRLEFNIDEAFKNTNMWVGILR